MAELTYARHPRVSPDVTILGAGIVGLAIALELRSRGAQVQVIDRGLALQQASTAAAGMLAAHDPHNPPALLPLAEHSLSLYPAFLGRIAGLSGVRVPFQTEMTVQYLDDNATVRLVEQSLDPRQLAPALLTAVRNCGVDLVENDSNSPLDGSLSGHIVYAKGAWTAANGVAPAVLPCKGQMLRVRLPPSLQDLREVHRNERIYIVPRSTGPQAGSAILGATVEDAGFDVQTHADALSSLRSLAAGLLPAFADVFAAPQLEAWAGLRPATADQLPILGKLHPARRFIATGHYRNGILLAPATADVLADLIEGKQPRIDLTPFAPGRSSHSTSHISADIRPPADDNDFIHLR